MATDLELIEEKLSDEARGLVNNPTGGSRSDLYRAAILLVLVEQHKEIAGLRKDIQSLSGTLGKFLENFPNPSKEEA